jgi:hypothetical protein
MGSLLRSIVRLVGFLFLASLVAGVASAVAAAFAKRSLEVQAEPEDDLIMFGAIFDGRELASTATAFRGGRILCWYAGVEADLRGARLDPAGGRLDVYTIFGGTEVVVPPGWHVRLHGASVFGGAQDARQHGSDDGPVLDIHHWTIFGGLGISDKPATAEDAGATPIAEAPAG